ncbi:MAG: tight adherence protein C [Bacteroidia bacterium]|jgi:tight adherence protein C
MMFNLLNDISSWSLGLSLLSIVFLLSLLRSMLPDEDRSFLDPLPKMIVPLWPLIRIVAYFGCSNLPVRMLERIESKLQHTGGCYILDAEEFLALSVVTSMLFTLLTFVALVGSGDVSGFALLGATLVGYFLPDLWLRDSRKKRDSEIIKTLPMFLEFLSMCVDAGLNFSGALKQAMDKGPRGAMRNEFRIVLRDMRSGQSRADALMRLEDRIQLKEVSVFVNAMIQAERMGASIKNTLKIQSEQRLTERFQRAEKQAMEAPVKLVIPLIIFIFPLTFIILLYPIVVRFMAEGGL